MQAPTPDVRFRQSSIDRELALKCIVQKVKKEGRKEVLKVEELFYFIFYFDNIFKTAV